MGNEILIPTCETLNGTGTSNSHVPEHGMGIEILIPTCFVFEGLGFRVGGIHDVCHLIK